MVCLKSLILACSLCLVPSLALSHGGGLDGYGCHHNRKQGGYHCHRGAMAGQTFASKQEMLSALQKGDKKSSGDTVKTPKKQKE